MDGIGIVYAPVGIVFDGLAGRDDLPAGGGGTTPAASQLLDGPPLRQPANARHPSGLAHPSAGNSRHKTRQRWVQASGTSMPNSFVYREHLHTSSFIILC